MRKFKLINSYPGSPKLGLEVFENGVYYDSCETNFLFHKPRYIVENQSKFWKEIFDLDMSVGTKFKVVKSAENTIYTIGDIMNDGEVPIYWITRYGESEIQSYDIKDVNNYFKDKVWVEIAKKPIYTTEDGVEIFIGDKVKYVFYVLPNFNVKYYNPSFDDRDLSNNHYFSTEDQANNYVKRNKPIYSINEVNKACDEIENNHFQIQKHNLLARLEENIKKD